MTQSLIHNLLHSCIIHTLLINLMQQLKYIQVNLPKNRSSVTLLSASTFSKKQKKKQCCQSIGHTNCQYRRYNCMAKMPRMNTKYIWCLLMKRIGRGQIAITDAWNIMVTSLSLENVKWVWVSRSSFICNWWHFCYGMNSTKLFCQQNVMLIFSRNFLFSV